MLHLIVPDLSILGQYLHLKLWQMLVVLDFSTMFWSELFLIGLSDLGLRSFMDELEVIVLRIWLSRVRNYVIEGCMV